MTHPADNSNAPSTGKAPVAALSYATGPEANHGPQPWWVYGVVGTYLLLLGVLLTFPAWATILFDLNRDQLAAVTVFCVALIVSGLTLVMIPVRRVRRRPVTRRSIWIPIAGSGVLAGVLLLGGGLAVFEYLRIGWFPPIWMAAGVGAVWLVWGLVFGLIAMRSDADGVGAWLSRAVIAGSVLELLIAVPCHIVVRRRNECCAGIGTGMGICFGVVVMFIAFGPSVLMLFYRRRKQITGK